MPAEDASSNTALVWKPDQSSVDYLTVTFPGEIPLLQLQARSMAKHLDPAALGKILVILNEGHVEAYRERFANEILPCYGPLAGRVALLDAETMLPGIMAHGGAWRRQQALKLAAHRWIDADVYVALDTKNHLIRPSRADACFTAAGALGLHKRRLWRVAEACLDFMEMPPEARPEVVSNVITPYPLITRHVASLCEELVRRGHDLTSFFFENRELYEFALYYAWILRNGLAAQYDLNARPISVGFWPLEEGDQAERVGRTLAAARRAHVQWLGIHRRTAKEPEAVWRQVCDFWQEQGLVDSAEAGEALFRRLATKPRG